MKPFAIVPAFGLALVVACSQNSGPSSTLALTPVLDSIFVGDTAPAPTIVYTDGNGNPLDPGTVRWFSSNAAVLHVDSLSGKAVGLKAGFAQVLVSSHNLTAASLVVVSRALTVTLLLDTLYLMPGDTLTVPVAVLHQTAGTPTVWFRASPNAVFAIDSSSGLDSAKAPGGPVPFVAFAALGADTVADSGTVEVVSLTDTIGGKAGYTMFGTVIRSAKAAAQAVNYPRVGDTLTFRLRAFIAQGITTVEAVVVTVRTAVTATGEFPVDSLGLTEALGIGTLDPVCRPLRNWGSWSTIATDPPTQALSRQGGQIVITQLATIPHGLAIGGRFAFTAQRTDLYGNSLGGLPIRGTFVAPLVPSGSRCAQ